MAPRMEPLKAAKPRIAQQAKPMPGADLQGCFLFFSQTPRFLPVDDVQTPVAEDETQAVVETHNLHAANFTTRRPCWTSSWAGFRHASRSSFLLQSVLTFQWFVVPFRLVWTSLLELPGILPCSKAVPQFWSQNAILKLASGSWLWSHLLRSNHCRFYTDTQWSAGSGVCLCPKLNDNRIGRASNHIAKMKPAQTPLVIFHSIPLFMRTNQTDEP